MSEPFIGQIQPVGFNFAPRGWAHCNGQLLAISSNTALFSLLGTTYGGDGRSTFALPDLRGRICMHPGQGPGLSNYTWGQKGGAETVNLSVAQIPAHNHSVQLRAKATNANSTQPGGNVMATGREDMYLNADSDVSMNASAISQNNIGGGGAHPNRQPYLGVYWCIALTGIYPSRNKSADEVEATEKSSED